MGAFRRTLDSLDALVRSCVDCDRYPKDEQGAGDVVADCSKTYVSIMNATPIGSSGACRVYNLEVQVALVYVCADSDNAPAQALCVIDDAEAVACCLDAANVIGVDQVVCGKPSTTKVQFGRPMGGAYVARLSATLAGVVCCGD